MKSGWSFFRFDYALYQELRVRLRNAFTDDDFAALSNCKETRFLLEQLQSGELTVEETRAEYVSVLCLKGDPLSVHRGFSRCIAALTQYEDGEEGKDLLSALMAGGRNLEDWMRQGSTISGFLTPEETFSLYVACVPPAPGQGGRKRRKRPRRRTGGVVGMGLHMMRILMDRGASVEDMMQLFLGLLADAVSRGEGVAVVGA